jgi:hypothetical protein
VAGAAASLAEDVHGMRFEVPVGALTVMDGVREHALDEHHVQCLVETAGQWPPILVWEARDMVLDGAHRLAAAKLLGMETVLATAFAGTSEEAYVEAVRRNVTHGLPLTLNERTTAAGRILGTCPQWSDRRISLTCGLSAKTVARIRREAASRGHIERSRVRVGRDGRSRPVEPGTVREQIAHAIFDHPDKSLRAIAASVGASPETVRSVRRSVGQPAADKVEAPEVTLPRLLPFLSPTPRKVEWSQDRALSSCPSSEDFLTWFESTEVGEEWAEHVDTVPLSRVYEVADEARRRAQVWRDFAEALEGRVRLKRA